MAPPEAQEQAFDAEPYTLPIPKLDGHTADKLVLAFGGSVELDRTIEDDLALIEKLKLGQDVTFVVECTVAGKGFTYSRKGEDDTEHVVDQVKLRVHSLEERASE